MLRALWFLVQSLVVIAAAIWLLQRPGDVTFNAFDYTLTVQTGLFLIFLGAFILFFGVAMRVAGAIISLPGWLGGWSRQRRRARAFRQLTQGYACLAAGEADKALKRAELVQDALPEVQPLALLLEAQSQRTLNNKAASALAYQKLMADKDAAFLGLKGLLGLTVESGHTEKALEYAQQAMKLHPRTAWVIKTLYDLQIAQRDFAAARHTLKKAVKSGAIEKQKAISDEIAMLMIEAARAEEAGKTDEAQRLYERATKLDPGFIPPLVSLASSLLEKGKTRRLQNLIEQAWKINPHPDLIVLWDKIAPKNTSRDMMKRMRWYESLVALNPASALGHMAAGQTALESGLVGEARAYLAKAEAIEPSAPLYRLFLKLERAEHANENTIRALEEKLIKAPPAKVWTCRKTGHVYERWMPVAQPYQSFNTIVWDYPKAPASVANQAGMPDPAMIEAL